MPSANDVQYGGDHYKKGDRIQHWDLITDHGVPYLEGNATKYVYRWRDKNGVEDLKKALHYVIKLTEKYDENKTLDMLLMRRLGLAGCILMGKVPRATTINFCQQHDVPYDESEILVKILDWRTRKDLTDAAQMIQDLIAQAS